MASIRKIFSIEKAGVAYIRNTASAYHLYSLNEGGFKHESGLSNELFFQTKISLAQI